jgi:O-antigen/teichoic acid export membrane protein
MMFHGLAALVAFLLGAWWLYIHLPTPVKMFESKFETSEWIRVALPFLLTGGMQIMNNRLDILVVSWFWPDAEVGIYEVAVQVSMLIGLGLSATNMLVGPYLSRYYSENKTKVLQKIVSAAVTFSTVLALPPLLVLVGFGDVVLEIVFGKEYARGYAALVLLCFGQFSHVVSGSVGFLLNMTGHERITLRGVSAATVANLALNFALTPLYGMEGAAWATLITFVLWNAILVHWAYRKLSVDPSLIGFLR